MAVFLSTGALGVLGAFESAEQNANAIRAFGAGPQKVLILWPDPDHPWDPREADSLREVPGVRAGTRVARGGRGRCIEDGTCMQVYVGTCADLELSVAVTGCDDSRAAVITAVEGDRVVPLPGPAGEPPARGNTIFVVNNQGQEQHPVVLDGNPIIQDLSRQREEWSWPAREVAFVPLAVAADWFDPSESDGVTAVADGGSAMLARLQDWADARGIRHGSPLTATSPRCRRSVPRSGRCAGSRSRLR